MRSLISLGNGHSRLFRVRKLELFEIRCVPQNSLGEIIKVLAEQNRIKVALESKKVLSLFRSGLINYRSLKQLTRERCLYVLLL